MDMLDKTSTPIFITGIERSGASMIAKIICMCGAFSGEVNEKNENVKLKDLCLDYYSSIGADLQGQFPLPDAEALNIPSDWKKRVLKRLQTEEGFDENKLWMYKSAKIGQIWPVWNYAFPNAKWILVRRKTSDVVSSCLKTAYMDAFKNEIKRTSLGVSNESDGWLWWIHNHEVRFRNMIEAGVNVKVIWPERLVDADYSQIFEVVDWLGLQWNNKIFSEIDPLLWNTRNKERSK